MKNQKDADKATITAIRSKAGTHMTRRNYLDVGSVGWWRETDAAMALYSQATDLEKAYKRAHLEDVNGVQMRIHRDTTSPTWADLHGK